MPDRLADLYALERELREAIADGGPDHPNYAIWRRVRWNVLAEMQTQRCDYSAAQPVANIPLRRKAA